MLTELHARTKPAEATPRAKTPRWLLEYNDHHGHLASERWRADALASQTSHELHSLSKMTEGGARRVVVDQQVSVCTKLLTRLERYLSDNPSFFVTDPLVLAALDKRAKRRLEAQAEIASEHNTRQMAFNDLVAQAGRDIDLVRDMAHSLQQEPKWARQLGLRLRATAEKLLQILAEADETLNTQMNQSVSDWLTRTAKLIEMENEHDKDNTRRS